MGVLRHSCFLRIYRLYYRNMVLSARIFLDLYNKAGRNGWDSAAVVIVGKSKLLDFIFCSFWICYHKIQEVISTWNKKNRTKSRDMQITYRRIYRTLEEFDLYGRYPAGVCAETSAERGSYWQLNPAFREVIDIYKDFGAKRGLKESTLYKTAFFRWWTERFYSNEAIGISSHFWNSTIFQ